VEQPAEPIPLLHPNLAAIYRERIARLCDSLNDDEGMPQAAEVLRSLIDQIRLVPDDGKLVIALRGDLAAILTFASNKKRPDLLSEAGLLGDLLSPVSLVAGTRNQHSKVHYAQFCYADGTRSHPLSSRRISSSMTWISGFGALHIVL
jgi:hypothetical protein